MDITQLLMFIRGINDNFEIMEEFLAMESLKEEERICMTMLAAMEMHKLPCSMLATVTTDRSPNLTGKKNIELLKGIQDKRGQLRGRN